MHKSVSKDQVRGFAGRLHEAACVVEVVADASRKGARLDPAAINGALSNAVTAIQDVAEELGDLFPEYGPEDASVAAATAVHAMSIEKPVAASLESLERISAMLYTARSLAFDSHERAEGGDVRASVVDALGELIDRVKERVDAVVEGIVDERRSRAG